MRLYAFSFGMTVALSAFSSVTQAQEITRPGQVAESAVGQAGQRQTIGNSQANIEPMVRLNNRIANRVQNRIRNRIDRTYDPTANTTSPFKVAAEQTTRGQPTQ
ncbi:hypothetical protein [Sphingobium cupriresistens]|uniref:Uncharacterized protein n=1 Tax=Sphingobium cupriresistens TaxID=1132417 RepID=A0A8G2DVA8_9SPHN|nr:hypothetical protein [Sphingobium cupriresistens]RYM07831.1 hypothetical protein EWH12_18040 [Sphingobium cupriresistens]